MATVNYSKAAWFLSFKSTYDKLYFKYVLFNMNTIFNKEILKRKSKLNKLIIWNNNSGVKYIFLKLSKICRLSSVKSFVLYLKSSKECKKKKFFHIYNITSGADIFFFVWMCKKNPFTWILGLTLFIMLCFSLSYVMSTCHTAFGLC